MFVARKHTDLIQATYQDDADIDVNEDLDDDPDNEAPVAENGSGFERDTYTYKNGIDETLEPITNIRQAFEDLVKRLQKHVPEFNEFLRSLKKRRIRIATMCSGTESPILALKIIAESKQLFHPYCLCSNLTLLSSA